MAASAATESSAGSGPNALRQPVSFADVLIRSLGQRSGRVCIAGPAGAISYAEVHDTLSRWSQAFAGLGLGPGHGVAVLSGNRAEVIYALGASALSGCRPTPLHPLGSADDHAYILEDAEIDTLLFDPEPFADRAAELAARVPRLAHLLAFGPSAVGTDVTVLADSYRAGPLTAPAVAGTTLFYTGGTTGTPKGVVPGAEAFATILAAQMAEWPWPADLRFLVATPLSHSGVAALSPTLLRQGSLVVMPRFEPDAFFDVIERYRITATLLVPTMIYALLDHPRIATADLSSLSAVFYGASAMSPERLAEAIRRFGPVFFQFYGQTEAPMTVCVLRQEDHDLDRPDRLASCGRPVPWVRVELQGPDGRPVSRGSPGEICVRGPLVMQEYWKRPEETAEALRGDWLHTGDIAIEDEDGFLRIVDRVKEMIVTGGFNIYPREIEDVLGSHPAVAASAVIGVPDPRWGEAVKAFVVCRPGVEVTPDDLIEVVRARKGSHHAPKTIEFIDAIPVGPLGKPDKSALRERFWRGLGRSVN